MELENESINADMPIAEDDNRVKSERKHYNKDMDKERNDKDPKKKFFKRKVCHFCKNHIEVLDYKDVKILKRYVKESGKIIPKRLTGTCSKHQRLVTKAIKRARNIALLPYETRY